MNKLSKPLPVMRYDFLNYLKDNNLKEFSTKNVMEFYEIRMTNLNKPFNKTTAYPAVHRQIIFLLLNENKIKRVSRGIYNVIKELKINKSKEEINDSNETNLDKIAEEKWSKLSSKGFNPDRLLTEETLNKIIK